MPEVIARKLSHRYRDIVAVDGLSFEARDSSVLCLLGPNGSGKSTTLALMLGLVHGSGHATFNGRAFTELRFPRRQVGVQMGLNPWNPGRTGAAHLRLLATASNISKSRVDAAADMVGLTEAIGRRITTYSLGMKQRLSLAAAFLGDPPILVLDEPTNGLDADGIRWLRELIATFAAEGRTLIVTSHLLSEVELVATDLVLLDRGRMRAAGSLDSLLADHVGSRVTGPDPDGLVAVLAAAGIRTDRSANWILAGADTNVVGAIAFEAGLQITRLEPTRNLEDFYRRVLDR